MSRSQEMKAFVDTVAVDLFGVSLTDAQEKQVCVICGHPADRFVDELSRKEYEISGMCQDCQNQLFGE